MNKRNVLNDNGEWEFLDTSLEEATEEIILEYLARIITGIYLRDVQKDESSSEEGFF
ncbi:MAG TPA: hypothetical protein VG621_02385 [Candidatus Paceibacterota bacterium]|nr:hypothetical protein [Candidatus Paceibacterota bacterium]